MAASQHPRFSKAPRPAYAFDETMQNYLKDIQSYTLLAEDEEYQLAKKWAEEQDPSALDKLIKSHLRLVAKIAAGYKGYGLSMSELIAEGNIGIMHAAKKFKPEKGFRFSTYAMWWIKAAIRDYIMKTWSLVRIGTTAAQKKLFFSLRSLKHKLQGAEERDLSPESIKKIAEELGVSEEEVISMEQRLSGGDFSLNRPVNEDGDGELEWQDWITPIEEDHGVKYEQQDELEKRCKLLSTAMTSLNERQRHVIEERRLKEPPATLEDLANELHISRERVRQIEVQAFAQLQKAIKKELYYSQQSQPMIHTPFLVFFMIYESRIGF